MPKDESGPSSISTDPSDPSYRPPLKRGDACLYCRKRRIRCSATKPSCQHCTKLKRECVYDSGKPVSRVKQLEDKVAELEELLRAGGPGGEGSSATAETVREVPPPLQHHGSSGTSNSSNVGVNGLPTASHNPATTFNLSAPIRVFSVGENIDTNMLEAFPTPAGAGSYDGFATSMFPSFAGSIFGATAPRAGTGFASMFGNAGGTGQGQAPVDQQFDFSTLDSGFMDLVNSFQATSTGAAEQRVGAVPVSVSGGATASQPANTLDALAFLSQTTSSFTSQPSEPTASFQTPFSPSTFLAPTPSAPFNPPSQPAGPPIATSSYSFGPPAPATTSVPYQAYVSDVPDPIPSSPNPLPPTDGNLESQKIGVRDGPESGRSPPDLGDGKGFGWKSDADVPMDGSLVGGWFDAADLPRVARDHLLDLFFSGMRMFGQEFHVPRFFAALTLPPAKRPHPALLYSMFLMASRITTSPPIRALEPHFYSIACKQLDEAIARADRLFDAVRAATILGVYKYSLARYHEGWMMTGVAARLAISCGLHQISSSVWKPSPIPQDQRADLVGIMRQRAYVIPAAKDPIELGERIWAFWAIYITDRCGSISSQWPPAIADEIVTTPYPKPLYEYEMGLVSAEDNYSISSLYEPEHRPLKHYADSSLPILRLRSLAILERASKLMYLKPEPGWETNLRRSSHFGSNEPSPSFSISPPGPIDEYLNSQNFAAMLGMGISPASTSASNSASTPASASASTGIGGRTGEFAQAEAKRGWMRTARIRTPKAYEEVRTALLRVEEDLPPERRTNWEIWDGNVQPWHFSGAKKDIVTLHFVLGCAWMFLFDVYSFNAENRLAVNVARRMAFTIRMVVRSDAFNEMDVFIAMTWSFIVKILIREAKRLQSVRDLSAAALLEADVDIVVQALRMFGKRYNIASMQALRAERYRRSTLDDMSFMEGDELDDEHVEVDRLPRAMG